MCKCTPEIRTPFCGKPGCEWPATKQGPAMTPREAEETPEQRAERIIKTAGLTFALASLPPQKHLAEARGQLKDAIVREISAAIAKAKGEA